MPFLWMSSSTLDRHYLSQNRFPSSFGFPDTALLSTTANLTPPLQKCVYGDDPLKPNGCSAVANGRSGSEYSKESRSRFFCTRFSLDVFQKGQCVFLRRRLSSSRSILFPFASCIDKPISRSPGTGYPKGCVNSPARLDTSLYVFCKGNTASAVPLPSSQESKTAGEVVVCSGGFLQAVHGALRF